LRLALGILLTLLEHFRSVKLFSEKAMVIGLPKNAVSSFVIRIPRACLKYEARHGWAGRAGRDCGEGAGGMLTA